MKRIPYTKKPLSNIEKLTKLLSFIFKNGLIHTHHFNGFLIYKGKLCNVKWIESKLDFDSGEYEYVPVTKNEDVSENVIARAEEIYGKYKIEQEKQEKIDSYVKELYRQSDDFTI